MIRMSIGFYSGSRRDSAQHRGAQMFWVGQFTVLQVEAWSYIVDITSRRL